MDDSDEEPLLRPGQEERQNLLGDNSENEDDDFFLHGPKPKLPSRGNLDGVRGQVQEVTSIMRENMAKVLERGSQLSELGDRAENLNDLSTEFMRQGTRLRQQAWWQEKKTLLIGSTVGVLFIILLIIIFSR